MNKSTWVVIVLVLIAIALTMLPSKQDSYAKKVWHMIQASSSMSGDDAKEDTNNGEENGEKDMNEALGNEAENAAGDDEAAEASGSVVTESKGYVAYDADSVKDALADGKNVILFFHATRCPTCKAADMALNATMGQIPANVVIYKVDYDTSTALKAKYGVTSQHTFVYLNSDMSAKGKATGATDLATILAGIK